ncbi:FAD binding domain-containing protein [Acidisoma sp. 7E03]
MRPMMIEAPTTLGEAIRGWSGVSDGQEAEVHRSRQYLAGGTNLLDLMKLDVMRPSQLVHLAHIDGRVCNLSREEDGFWLGSGVRMSEAAADGTVQREFPVIAESLDLAASPQLRNMASLGGNVLQRTRCPYFRDPLWRQCNKRDPGSGCGAMGGCDRRLAVLGVSTDCKANYPGDFANALIALGASVTVLSPTGQERRFPFADLHRLPGSTPHLETTLAQGEVIIGFTVPYGAWTRRSRYVKVRDRAAFDFALASAAVALAMEGDRVVEARIALGGLATRPWRSPEAEAVLRGQRLDEAAANAAAERALSGAVAQGETAFKVTLGQHTLVRALLEARAMEIPA